MRVTGGAVVEVGRLGRTELRALRREMQMIFQDPFSSLNPRMTLFDLVGEPLLVHGVKSRREREERVAELLRRVGLRPEYMRRFPHAFSGGERQRIGIARALALRPRLVVADEPVSALDVSVQAQILNLLQDLQAEFQLTYLFVAHDLSVVRHISDRVAVMYVGRIVELAETEDLFTAPKHPYTAALLSAVPEPDPRLRSRRIILQGEVANPASPPSGCYFHPRCPHAIEVCRTQAPAWQEIAPAPLRRLSPRPRAAARRGGVRRAEARLFRSACPHAGGHGGRGDPGSRARSRQPGRGDLSFRAATPDRHVERTGLIERRRDDGMRRPGRLDGYACTSATVPRRGLLKGGTRYERFLFCSAVSGGASGGRGPEPLPSCPRAGASWVRASRSPARWPPGRGRRRSPARAGRRRSCPSPTYGASRPRARRRGRGRPGRWARSRRRRSRAAQGWRSSWRS